MNTILIVATVILSVLIIVTTILFISLKFCNEKKRENRIQELLYYNEVYSDISAIEDSIDTFIQTIFDSYQIFHSEYFSKEFLSEDDQKRIILEVHKEVNASISPSLMNRMLLLYNAEKLPEIINKKIFILVIQVAENINSTPSDNSINIDKILRG